MEKVIHILCQQYFGQLPDQVQLMPASGSARKYYRIFTGGDTCIAAWNQNVEENQLFIDFSRHFRLQGLHVPEIYAVATDKVTYLQEDLGNQMLLDVVEKEQGTGKLSDSTMNLYRKSLVELLRFQILGHEGLDYSKCIPRSVFDKRCILWDLNYFKYCFLRLAGAVFSEEALENDFEQLVACLCQVPADAFMFRDFQSRNIMIREENVWFIDYQGGRQGALHYDVASLLYDAIVDIPEEQREELLGYYIGELQYYHPVNEKVFRRDYYSFVLIRLLQAMGAFGLRGLYEHKQHFIDSIQPALRNLTTLLNSGNLDHEYPEIRKVVCTLQK